MIYRELLLNNNLLRSLPYELGKLFQLQSLGLNGNPLCKEFLKLYAEPNGTQKLLTYLLDSLTGKVFSFPSMSWTIFRKFQNYQIFFYYFRIVVFEVCNFFMLFIRIFVNSASFSWCNFWYCIGKANALQKYRLLAGRFGNTRFLS